MKFKEFISLLENTSSDVEKPPTSSVERLDEIETIKLSKKLQDLTSTQPQNEKDDEIEKTTSAYVNAIKQGLTSGTKSRNREAYFKRAKENRQKFANSKALGMREHLEDLTEVLSKSAPIEDWIHDFVHSDNPKFDGKTEKERRDMAIAAYYAAHGKSKKSQHESLELQVERILNELNGGTSFDKDKANQDLEKMLGKHIQGMKTGNYGGSEDLGEKLEKAKKHLMKNYGLSYEEAHEHVNNFAQEKYDQS